MSTTWRTLTGAFVCALAVAFVLIGTALAVTSEATVGARATKQRVAMTMKGLPYGTFVLAPLQTGALKRDVGTSSISYPDPHVLIRDGQKIEIYAAIVTLVGTRGTLVIRERLEVVNAGDALVGTGRWIVVRGTRGYAEIAGGGRTAHVGHDHGKGQWFAREEGYLVVP